MEKRKLQEKSSTSGVDIEDEKNSKNTSTALEIDSGNSENRYLGSRGERSRNKRSRSRSRKYDKDKSRRRLSSEKERRRRRRHRRTSSSSSSSHYRSCSRSPEREGPESRRTSRSRRKYSYYSSDDSSNDIRGTNRRYETQTKTNSDSYKLQTPNSTIMVRGLDADLKENDIRDEVIKGGFLVKDVRLIRNHETGASRGFAFVEFNSVMDATRWMEVKKGVLHVGDKCEANLIYSFTKNSFSESKFADFADWLCKQCNGRNFRRRVSCYKCYAAKPQGETHSRLNNVVDEIQSNSSAIVLSNLDTLTTEEAVLQVLQLKPNISHIPIKSLKIVREPNLHISTGECYLEANNCEDAHAILTALKQETIEIDGRLVAVSIRKILNLAEHIKNCNAGKAALEAAQWTNNTSYTTNSTASFSNHTFANWKLDVGTVEAMAQVSAKLYATTKDEFVSYLEYYRQYYTQEIVNNSAESSEAKTVESIKPPFVFNEEKFTNEKLSACPVNPVVAALVLKADFCENLIGFESTSWPDNQNSIVRAGIVCADLTSQYQYDETSGYYFDPTSHLYYDAATTYFYDAEKQQFLYWSPNEKKYIEVTKDTTDKNGLVKNDIEKPEKIDHGNMPTNDQVTVAKRIVKEMNKWEKRVNSHKGSLKQTSESNSNSPKILRSTAEHKMSEESTFVKNPKICNSSLTNHPRVVTIECNKFSLMDNIIDERKLLCLLCKRRFISDEMLQKHVKMSDLHKQNLEILKQVEYNSSPTSSTSYRDRAKERRETYGSKVEFSGNTLKECYLQRKDEISTVFLQTKQPTICGLENDNKGNQMLQKMGWKMGQGLGKTNQGIVDIIEPKRRSGKFGLGIRQPRFDTYEMDSKLKTHHELTLHRYNELD